MTDEKWLELDAAIGNMTGTQKKRQMTELQRLREANATLRRISVDIAWMARRYANNRSTYAPDLYNECARTLLEMGVELNPTGDGTIWAKDGDGYDSLSTGCHTPGHPEATGHVIPLPRGTHLARELEELLGTDVTAAIVEIKRLKALEGKCPTA